MSERVKRRNRKPPIEPLEYAVAAQKGLQDAKAERDRAFLSAANAGWTMVEIGEAVGIAQTTVWRRIVRAEQAEASRKEQSG